VLLILIVYNLPVLYIMKCDSLVSNVTDYRLNDLGSIFCRNWLQIEGFVFNFLHGYKKSLS